MFHGFLVVPSNHTSPLRERAHGKFREEHRAGFIQTVDASGVVSRDLVFERLGAPGGQDALGVEKIFRAERNSVQRAAIFSGADLFVGFGGLLEREILGQRDRRSAASASIS